MKIKVCMLTTGHPALDARIFYKEARSLQRAGFEVFVMAPLTRNEFLLDRGETTINGIKIIGCKEKQYDMPWLSEKIYKWPRIVTAGQIGIGQDPFSDITDKGIQINADIYHCHEIGSLYAGIQIKRRLKKKGRNAKLIYDVHEFWPAKKNKRIGSLVWSKIVSRFERKALEHVDYVITVNQIIRGHILSLNRFIKTEVLYNCPDLSIFQEYDRETNHETITICHEGELPFNRGLKEILEVMKILKARYNGKVKLLIVGDVFGDQRNYLEQKIKEYQIEDIVERTGWLSYEKVGAALSNCSIGIIFLELTRENNIFSSPNKLFNYMRYGLPIVTVDLPEIRRIVLESQCGIVVRERTVNALADALSTLIENMDLRRHLGENGKKAVIDMYNWGVMEKRLLRIYDELISSPKYIM